MKRAVVIFLFFMFGVLIPAQKDSARPMFRISSISIGAGANQEQKPPFNKQTLLNIAPGNLLVRNSPDVFQAQFGTGGGNVSYSAMLGFRTYSKKRKDYKNGIEHRVGIRYYRSHLFDVYYSNGKHHHLDSIQSVDYPGSYYKNVEVDSSWHYSFYIQRSGINLDFGSIYESDASHLLRAYMGYQGSIGASVSSELVASEILFTTISQYRNTLDADYKNLGNERTKLKNSFNCSAQLLGGVNIRFAKRPRGFFRRLSLSAEGRAGVSSEQIQHYGFYTRFSVGGQLQLKVLL